VRPLRLHALARALLLLLVVPSVAFAASPDPTPTPRVGDRGVALTALRGNVIEELPVEYIGRLPDFNGPGYDVLVVKLLGETAAHVGVAAGMSGSPVYFDGELVGALAYRMSGGGLPSEPIAGVTPIADMLAADKSPAGRSGASGGGAQPIATPVSASGLHPAARGWLSERLEPLGLILSAGGAEGPQGSVEPLRPGSPVGVELVRGEMSLAATGTVTWVDGERILAFGHPFLGSGRVSFPMVGASVVLTLPDLAGSMKLANTGGVLGAIVEDRLTAIVGRTDVEAKMIPFRLTLRGGVYGSREHRFEMTPTSRLMPMLSGAILANTLLGSTNHDNTSTLLARGKIELAGLPALRFETALASDGASDPAILLAIGMQRIMAALWLNSHEEASAESVEVEIEVTDGIRSYRIESLNYDRGPLVPGSLLEVQVVLQPFRGETERRRLAVRVPEGLAPGTRLLLAIGPPDRIDETVGRSSNDRVDSATSLAAVVRALNDRKGAHRLTAVLYSHAAGAISRGAVYPALPPTAARLIGSDLPSSARPQRHAVVHDESEIELDGPVSGGVAVALRVVPSTENAR